MKKKKSNRKKSRNKWRNGWREKYKGKGMRKKKEIKRNKVRKCEEIIAFLTAE